MVMVPKGAEMDKNSTLSALKFPHIFSLFSLLLLLLLHAYEMLHVKDTFFNERKWNSIFDNPQRSQSKNGKRKNFNFVKFFLFKGFSTIERDSKIVALALKKETKEWRRGEKKKKF
jgi:hypothetical protein